MEGILWVEKTSFPKDLAWLVVKGSAGMGQGHVAGTAFGLNGLLIGWKASQVHTHPGQVVGIDCGMSHHRSSPILIEGDIVPCLIEI
jgi:hypothetical protein